MRKKSTDNGALEMRRDEAEWLRDRESDGSVWRLQRRPDWSGLVWGGQERKLGQEWNGFNVLSPFCNCENARNVIV
ncbi:hypothetical protein M0R45_005699 [Rubus argutus]|uniref:Uncharacterized protein n=1 Tax=Rubus argutus TaxID=59490 RepID=A0AAW1YNI3_RUBAR